MSGQHYFSPHGTTRFERRGQVLLLHSEGPFNAEHIASLVPQFREHAARLAPDGPWVSINVISRSLMTPPDVLEALTRNARWSRDELGRIGIAYVATEDVEGYRVMMPLMRRASDPVLPTRFFTTLDEALHWAQSLLDAAAAAGRND